VEGFEQDHLSPTPEKWAVEKWPNERLRCSLEGAAATAFSKFKMLVWLKIG